MCEALGVVSQNDREKLKYAKERCYKLGFNFGVMACGKYKGMPVTEAKLKVRQDMIEEGLAAEYFEPEKLVVSRSGDECVVSFEDQWYVFIHGPCSVALRPLALSFFFSCYVTPPRDPHPLRRFLDYGEEKWRDIVLNHVNNEQNFSAYDPKVLGTYNIKLNWLGQWACSRQFGLGTRLPCDPDRFVIESLSDSTIYMVCVTASCCKQKAVPKSLVACQ